MTVEDEDRGGTATTTTTTTTGFRSWGLRFGVGLLAFLAALMLTLDGDDVAFLTGSSTRYSAKVYDYSSTNNSGDDDDLVFAESPGKADQHEKFQHDSQDLTALPLEERKKFSFQGFYNNYNHSIYTEPKETPSGWWPNDEWMRWCADPRKASQFRPFSSRKKWEGYRLGDCIKQCTACPKNQSLPHLAHWTIAGEYHDLACDPAGPGYHVRRGNATVLDQIIERRNRKQGYRKPPPKAMVIHLRLGDKMETSPATVEKMIRDGADPGRRSFHGLHAVKSIYEFLTNIHQSGLSRVIIRGGSQIPDMYKKSKHYAYCLKLAAAKAGYNATMNLEESNADADFYYMVHAKHIIVSVGGFSRFIGQSVLRRGGIMYGRYF